MNEKDITYFRDEISKLKEKLKDASGDEIADVQADLFELKMDYNLALYSSSRE